MPKLLLVALLIIFGVFLLLVFINISKRERSINKYLKNDLNEKDKNTTILSVVDAIIPSSVAMNEKEIGEKIVNAGYYAFQYANLYLPTKYFVIIVGFMLISLFLYNSTELFSLLAILSVWVIVSLVVPDIVLESKIRSYRAKVSRELPYIIDLLAVCVQTGMTIEASIGYMSRELRTFEPKIAHLLERMDERARVIGMEKALEEVYEHIPTTEMRSFVMTLKQSLQYGSSIYQTLTVLSADIRQVTMLNVEEKIGKLAAKMSVPLILLIMFPIVILIAAPGVMRMMSGI